MPSCSDLITSGLLLDYSQLFRLEFFENEELVLLPIIENVLGFTDIEQALKE